MGMFVAGVAKAALAQRCFRGRGPPRGGYIPPDKWTMMVVVALALLALCLRRLIPASQAPNAEHYSVESTDYQGATQARRPRRGFPSLRRRLR